MPGMKATMEEFKAGKLHSGSKRGPVVTSRKQAIAIGMAEAGKATPKGGMRTTHAKAGKGPNGRRDGDLIRRALGGGREG